MQDNFSVFQTRDFARTRAPHLDHAQTWPGRSGKSAINARRDAIGVARGRQEKNRELTEKRRRQPRRRSFRR